MSVADSDLPVWTIRPNWANGVTERLEWETDVIAASDGSEQTRSLRLSPRREFECDFNPWDQDRSYFDLWLHRLAAAEFMVPLWHDRGRLSASRIVGATAIAFDNANREFTVGGLALLLGDDAQTWEKVTITAQDDMGITISEPGLVSAWPVGASIYPLRRTRLSDESQLKAITTRVGQATIQFQLNQANDIADEGEWSGLTFETYPVLIAKPDYSEAIDTSYLRQAFALDGGHGLRHLADDAGRAFTVQAHSWQMRGRAEHMAFRQMLYRLRGMSQAAWLPTFNEDVKLARAAAAANNYLHIRKIGYAYTGGAVDGRNRILLGGTTPLIISSTGAPLAAGEERLNLSTPVGADFAAGVSGSFLAASRLNTDSVEIKHYSDTDGVAECKTTFRQFKNNRVAPAILSYPIPASVMSDAFCGEPGDAQCVNMTVFEGWYARALIEIAPGISTTWDNGSGICNPDGAGPAQGIFFIGNESQIYDRDGPRKQVMLYWYDAAHGGIAGNVECMGTGLELVLQLQFGAGSVPAGAKFRFSFQRWNETTLAPIVPHGVSDTSLILGEWSDFHGLWPEQYLYTV